MTFVRRMSATLIALLLAVLSVAVAPATAAEAASCSGTIIKQSVAKAGTTVVGELLFYYDYSTGYNCAKFTHRGPAYGVAAPTTVLIQKCAETTPDNYCTEIAKDSASGNYAYSAWASVYAPRNCVQVSASIYWAGAMRYAHIGGGAQGLVGC